MLDKMLSNVTCVETRIQRLFDGLIFVEKRLRARAAHGQNEKGLYTGRNFKQNIKKNEGKLGTLFTIVV